MLTTTYPTSKAQQPTISARHLSKNFGDVQAVQDVSFSVAPGEILGVLGPNGAGKSTTINMMTTLTPIGSGRAEISGFDVTKQASIARQLFGVAGQSAALDEKLTARENLRLFGRLYKIPRATLDRKIEDLVKRFDLSDFADRPVATYSGGQRRRVDVVGALVNNPPALFLDEPTTGLDPRSRTELWKSIRALAAQGTAIVLTTQYLEEADLLANQIILIDHGCIIAQGTPTQLKNEIERDILEVQFKSDHDLDTAQSLIDSGGQAVADTESRQLRISVGKNRDRALELLTKFRSAGLDIRDFQLRKPTLDDVFLTLTDSSTATSSAKESE